MHFQLRPAITLFVALSLLTGLVYPLAVTGLAQLAFPAAANGSLIVHGGKIAGSALIGQPFGDPKHFWSRPSATGPISAMRPARRLSRDRLRNMTLAGALRMAERRKIS